MKRLGKPHDYRRPILIVCEGDLEMYYFKQLDRVRMRRPSPESLCFKIICNGGCGPKSIVQNAINRARGGYREAWCVMDVEGPNNSKNLREAINIAERKGVKIAIANPSFDAWAMAHLGSLATTCEEPAFYKEMLRDQLGRVFATHDGEEFVRKILGVGGQNLSTAKSNIKLCDNVMDVSSDNPSTNMHLLVRLFVED